METKQRDRDAIKLLRSGCSDEDVERRLGLSLTEIIGLRAGLAGAATTAIVLAPAALAKADEGLAQAPPGLGGVTVGGLGAVVTLDEEGSMASYRGTGTLVVDGEVDASVYTLETRAVGPQRDGWGTVAADFAALNRAFERGAATLTLSNGVRVPIVISELSHDRPARFQVAGTPTHEDGTDVHL